MRNDQPRQSQRRPGALHLIWAVPLAAVGAYVAYGLAWFHRCGIAVCRTPDRGGSAGVTLLATAAGLCLAAPFWFVPWSHRRRLRAWTGGVLAAATTLGIYLYVTTL
jgi:hypothetical protein